MPDLKNGLERLAKATAELNAQRDQVAKTIADLNARLAGMNLGIAVWLKEPFAEFDDKAPGYLGFAKAGDRWQLVYSTLPSRNDAENIDAIISGAAQPYS